MILAVRGQARERVGWPRTSGDDPDCLDTDIHEYVLAPHERG